MAKANENQCQLEVFIEQVELKHGNNSPWAKVQAHYMAEDRDKNQLRVPIRFTAFGVLAERCASVKGQAVQVRLAMGGWRNNEGKVWPDYTCQSVSRPWGETGGVADRTPPPVQAPTNDDGCPF